MMLVNGHFLVCVLCLSICVVPSGANEIGKTRNEFRRESPSKVVATFARQLEKANSPRKRDMIEENSVTIWISAIRQGDSAAASELWGRYFDQLLRQARRRMNTLPKAGLRRGVRGVTGPTRRCESGEGRDLEFGRFYKRGNRREARLQLLHGSANAELDPRHLVVGSGEWGIEPRSHGGARPLRRWRRQGTSS